METNVQTIKLTLDTSAINALEAKLQKIRDHLDYVRAAGIVGAAQSTQQRVGIDPIYCTNDYPREGCKVVISFENGEYSRIVYPPWVDLIPSGAPLESYSSRPLGSLGTALDAFARGGEQTLEVRRAMAQAERDYESSLKSVVTE